jgi:hypothetical protein
MVMVDVNGIMKSDHATTVIVQFHVPTLILPHGLNVLSRVFLLHTLPKIVFYSIVQDTEFLALELIALL